MSLKRNISRKLKNYGVRQTKGMIKMIKLEYHNYCIEIFSDELYTANSSDNSRDYRKKYIEPDDRLIIKYGIIIKDDNQEINSAIVIVGDGGATSPHKRSAFIDKDNLIFIIGDQIVSLSLPDLTLNWKTRCGDCVTCFELYQIDLGYIIHGETSILLVNEIGEIQWEFSGRDIFVTPDGKDIFTIRDEVITVNDWDYNIYKIGMNGKEIKQTELILQDDKGDAIQITQNGIRFFNKEKQPMFIDFVECQKNWFHFVKTSGEFSTNADYLGNSKCVGWRKIDGSPCYFEFFTEPRIRIEFQWSFHCLNPEKRFLELQRAINEVGWKTFDLS